MTKITGGVKPFAKPDHNKRDWRPSRKGAATLGGRIEISWCLRRDMQTVTAEAVEMPCTVRHATAIAALKRMIAARFVAVHPDEVMILSTTRLSEMRRWRVSGLRRENGTGRSVRFEHVVDCEVPWAGEVETIRRRLTDKVEAMTLSEVRSLRWEPAPERSPEPKPVTRVIEPTSPTLMADRFGQALIAAKGGVL